MPESALRMMSILPSNLSIFSSNLVWVAAPSTTSFCMLPTERPTCLMVWMIRSWAPCACLSTKCTLSISNSLLMYLPHSISLASAFSPGAPITLNACLMW